MLLRGHQIRVALCVDIRRWFLREGESRENQRCRQNTTRQLFLLRYSFARVSEGQTW